jgi:hypothetical protein
MVLFEKKEFVELWVWLVNWWTLLLMEWLWLVPLFWGRVVSSSHGILLTCMDDLVIWEITTYYLGHHRGGYSMSGPDFIPSAYSRKCWNTSPPSKSRLLDFESKLQITSSHGNFKTILLILIPLVILISPVDINSTQRNLEINSPNFIPLL